MLYKVWLKRLYRLPQLIVLWARRIVLKARGVKIGRGTVFESVEILGKAKNLTVNNESFIADQVRVVLHDEVNIGSRVVINRGVQILTASHDVRCPKWTQLTKPVKIGDYAWIAVDSTILPGVEIGEGAVIGACAVVSKNVEPYAVVAGNPAKVVGSRTGQLDYSPTHFSAPIQAWFETGKNQ